MTCAYCGAEIAGTDAVQYEGQYFCNAIHRYSFKTERTQRSADVTASAETSSAALFGGQVWTVIGVGIGMAIGIYSGIHGFVPFLLLVGVLWILRKTDTVPQAARGIIAVLTAQFGWMFIGALLTGQWDLAWFDLLFLGGGIIWLLISVHPVPVIILLLFQLGVMVINVNVFLQLEWGSSDHRAMSVHLVLRIMALIVLVNGLKELRRKVTA